MDVDMYQGNIGDFVDGKQLRTKIPMSPKHERH